MQDGSWQYNPDDGSSVSQDAAADYFTMPTGQSVPPAPDGVITWTASEFVAHHKSSGWYALLGIGAVVGAVIVWLITKDVVSAVVIIVAAGMFGAMANRQPRELSYQLDNSGLSIASRHYRYDGFRSFSIITEGAFASIVFTPLKRFAPLTTIYYDPADEARIVELLSLHLPMQERRQDPIDRLMWRIRF